MRIAYVSFEFPPDSAHGGIATYVWQVSNLMKARGHDVNVFCSSPDRSSSERIDGMWVHRIQCENRESFREEILPKFSEIHGLLAFDVLESPEYNADGLSIKKRFPSLPVVVKLHTPQFLIHELTNYHVTTLSKLRYMFGGFLRGRISKPFWKWTKRESDPEYQLIKIADQIHTPSISLGDIVSQRWLIPRGDIVDVPYPFIPDKHFLDISIPRQDPASKIFTYIGRLEVRKGIINLVSAAEVVLREIPDARFRIVGKSLQSHISGLSMIDFILRELKLYRNRIEFISVQMEDIPSILATTDVCVYPSLWENFPNVCLEAMSAGRAIVGSKEGGMKDMLAVPMAGLLVDPNSAAEISKAIVQLLNDPLLRVKLGNAARMKVLASYNNEVIGQLMEAQYSKLLLTK